MLFSRAGFFAAVLLVLGPVTVLCADGDHGNAGVLPMSSVTYDKDIPSDKASSSDPMANGTSSPESVATSQGNKLPPQQESMANTSDVNSTSEVSTDASVPSTQNASVSAASMARDGTHAAPPAPGVTEPSQTSPPTVQTSSPENTTVSASSSASHKPSPQALSSQDAATQSTSNAVAKQTSSSLVTTPQTGSSTSSSSSATQSTSSNDPGTTTPSSGTHEATTSSQPSPAATKPRVTENTLLNLTEHPEKLLATPSSSASPETTVEQAVTLPRPKKPANSTSTVLPNRPAFDLAALTNISEGEEVSITVIPEREEYAEKKNDSSAPPDAAPADRPSVEAEVTVSDAEKTTLTIGPVTPSSSVSPRASLSTEASEVHIVKTEPSPTRGSEEDKPTNLKTIDFHEYSTKETHQDIRPVLEMADQIQHSAPPSVEREEEREENVTLHTFPTFPINVSGLNSSTSVVVSVSFSDEENQTFMMTKDNVSLPVATPEASGPSVLPNIVPDEDSNSTLTGPSPNNDSGANGTGHHISVFRPISSNSSQHRKYVGRTRKTTVAPSGSTAGVLIAKGHASSHHGRAGLNLPTRKTTPGASGGTTQKPHIGRGGTRAPFGIIGSTRRTTLGTKATIRPLTKIFDRARTRSHTKATTARPGRGMRMRITTGKPVRKGFPIGPKPTFGNESAPFDLDAYTRLLNVTRRPSRPPQPTWRTTFFNVTDPTPGPNEVEAPVIRVAGIAKIIDGWEWSPLLGDHNTHEYRYLAYTTRRLLASVFRRTTEGRYFYRVDIDGFSPGSVIVDYFVLFYQRGGPVDPVELASAFNAQLGTNGSLGEEFFLDPTYTQFEVVGVVRPKPLASSSSAEPPVPQWAIAVIVIATASLIFIVLFGAVTIYGRTAERRKYSSRLQDDDLDNVTSSPSKDWESKLAASYENFAADSVYDTEDLQSPPPRDLLQYDERYRAW